jgi:hypothetical protein
MAKARSVDARLTRLRQLRGEPLSPQQLQELRDALRQSSNLVVAEAAEIAGELLLAELAPELAAAFERFLDDGERIDKLCRAKIAIVEALNKVEFDDEDFLLRGVRYGQLEPVWGGTHDTAVPVRVACAFGLVRTRHRGVLPLLVDMLVAEDKAERAGAVQALTYSGTEAALLVMRLKARLGDEESEVISECLSGILELSGEQSVAFVAEFLACGDTAVCEAALLALGGSRRPAAFEILKAFAEQDPGELQEAAYVALALLRLPAATDYLLSLIAKGPRIVAVEAVSALAVHRYDPSLRERTAEAVAKNGDVSVLSHFRKRFRTDN